MENLKTIWKIGIMDAPNMITTLYVVALGAEFLAIKRTLFLLLIY